jgi:dTMP kinase
MKGFFITIEGPEGCGKTTQSDMLVRFLAERGFEVVLTREPGGTRIGEKIRALVLNSEYREMTPLTELLLMASSRAQHVLEKIKPALSEGKIVVCSRFSDATIAYQGYGRGFDIALMKEVNGIATGGMEPDLTLLIDIDVRTGLERAFGVAKEEAAKGEGDRLENEDMAFHERVRDGYKKIAAEAPGRVVIIDGGKSIDEVAAAIKNAVETALKDKKPSR